MCHPWTRYDTNAGFFQGMEKYSALSVDAAPLHQMIVKTKFTKSLLINNQKCFTTLRWLVVSRIDILLDKWVTCITTL